LKDIFSTPENQVDSENIDTYVTELRKLAKSCEFPQLQGSLIKDHIVKKTEDNTEAKKILDEYADVFKGLGCLEGHYHIKIDSSVLPVVHPARKVPFAIKDRLKAELDRMENIGAITKVRAEGMGQFHCCNRKEKRKRACMFRPERSEQSCETRILPYENC